MNDMFETQPIRKKTGSLYSPEQVDDKGEVKEEKEIKDKASIKTENTQPVPVADTGERINIDHIVRIPKIAATDKKNDFARVNYPVREEMQEYITELSKRARISTSLIIEYLLEEYLLERKIEEIKDHLVDLGRKVKFEPNGMVQNKRKDLQLTLPKEYIELVNEATEEANREFGSLFDKGTLVDILLQAKMMDKH